MCFILSFRKRPKHVVLWRSFLSNNWLVNKISCLKLSTILDILAPNSPHKTRKMLAGIFLRWKLRRLHSTSCWVDGGWKVSLVEYYLKMTCGWWSNKNVVLFNRRVESEREMSNYIKFMQNWQVYETTTPKYCSWDLRAEAYDRWSAKQPIFTLPCHAPHPIVPIQFPLIMQITCVRRLPFFPRVNYPSHAYMHKSSRVDLARLRTGKREFPNSYCGSRVLWFRRIFMAFFNKNLESFYGYGT